MQFWRKSRLENLMQYKKSLRGNVEEEREKLERGDALAIAIAAIRVFLPILIVFIGVISLITWLVTR